MKRVTIQDIAKEMDLSRNTVAKAFHNGKIAHETKIAIIQKAWEMGYEKLDKALLEELPTTSDKIIKGTILVLFDRSQSIFWTRVLSGISDGAKYYGMRMQLHMADQEELDAEELLENLQEDVKGIIFLSVYPIRIVKGIAKCGLPMTFFNTPVYAEEYIELGDVYSLESFYAMNKITVFCIESRFCKSFAYIGNAEGSRVIQARYLGFLGACNSHYLELNQDYIFTKPVEGNSFTYGHVQEIVNGMDQIPDAIICEDDEVAMNVALALLERNPTAVGKTVITGFNGTIPKDFFKKDILTVEVHMEEAGKRLVESVVEKIINPKRDVSFVTLMTYPKI